MEFAWDDAKSEACLIERGFYFRYAVRVFHDPARRVEEDNRFDSGEPRFRVLGHIEGRLFVVVYTPRVGVFRIISARKANRTEAGESLETRSCLIRADGT